MNSINEKTVRGVCELMLRGLASKVREYRELQEDFLSVDPYYTKGYVDALNTVEGMIAEIAEDNDLTVDDNSNVWRAD